MALRPGDPQNIGLEFKIGTMVAQNPDPAHGQPVRPLDALPVFEGIVARYDHKVYYQEEPVGGGDSPELMVPRAAVLAASIRTGALHDEIKAREYLMVAMKDLQWTYEKRKNDWLSAPKPSLDEFSASSPSERAKLTGALRIGKNGIAKPLLEM